MKIDRRLLLAIGVIGVATLVWLLVTIGLIASTLTSEQRALISDQLAARFLLIGLTWVIGLVAIGATLRWLFYRYATAPARLMEQTRVLLAAPQAAPMNHQGTKETKALAQAIYELATQRDTLRADVAAQIAQGSLSVQQEKNRLAALMSELTQSVVVCNLDGRIILYNSRARLQFKALSNAPALAGGSELVGIGRSIYAVFDRQLVAHALESIQQRISRGAGVDRRRRRPALRAAARPPARGAAAHRSRSRRRRGASARSHPRAPAAAGADAGRAPGDRRRARRAGRAGRGRDPDGAHPGASGAAGAVNRHARCGRE